MKENREVKRDRNEEKFTFREKSRRKFSQIKMLNLN